MYRASPALFARIGLIGIMLVATGGVALSERVIAQDAAATPGAPLEIALNDVSGASVGTATFTENDDGTVALSVTVEGLPTGEHGIHVHAMGVCDPAGEQPFSTAGPHYNPTEGMHDGPPADAELATPGGDPTLHAGDFGNLTVGDDGTGTLEATTSRFSLSPGPRTLFDADGSALIIHAQADDLTSQPSGNSGGRIVCGVIAAPTSGAMASPTAVIVDSDVLAPALVPFSDDLLNQLNVPDGFAISVFAQGLDGPRMLAYSPDGVLYVTEPMANMVLGLRDTDGDGQADESFPAASGLSLVHGIVFHEGRVYLAGEKQVWVADLHSDGTFTAPEVILDMLPDGGQHPRRTIAIGPDGMIYVSLGSTCNVCMEPNPESATIIRANLDGTGREIFASGLRNTIGFAFHPETGALWGWDQGSDFRGADQPPEEFNQIVQGGHYGWPYCFADQTIDEYDAYSPLGATDEQFCANTEVPVLTYQAHSSPIGFLFYTADQFPTEFQGDGFIAMRGSWNRDPAVGYEIVQVDFEDGQPVSAEPFITGWLSDEGTTQFGRIAGLTVAPDGSLLISDDTNGVIYRVAATSA